MLPALRALQATGWVQLADDGRWHLSEAGRDRSLHLLAAIRAHEDDLLARLGYNDGALLKLQLQKFIASTNPGLPDLWQAA